MRHPLSIFFFLLLACLPAVGKGEANFEYGPRPENSIYDPEGTLPPELTKRLAADLKLIRERDRADVLLILLPSIGDLPPEHVARRFGEAWGVDLMHAVVLDVAGRNDGPWIQVGGEVTYSDRKEQIPRMMRDAVRLARQEPDRESCLRSAVGQASGIVRYILGVVRNQGQAFNNEVLTERAALVQRAERRQIIMTSAALGIFPLAGTLFLIGSFIRRRIPRRFPLLVWNRRLGAPHAGGNNATLDLPTSFS